MSVRDLSCSLRHYKVFSMKSLVVNLFGSFLIGLLIVVGALPTESFAGKRFYRHIPDGAGLSGMAQIDGERYLVVHDTKADEDGPRLGIISVGSEPAVRYVPLFVKDWNDPEGRSNDLESVCAIPGRPDEFLAAESGYVEGRYGRIFHIQLTGLGNKLKKPKAEVVGVVKLPLFNENDESQVKDNYEGMACVSFENNRLLLFFGERGGSQSHPDGVVRWAELTLGESELIRSDEGDQGIVVAAPGPWVDDTRNRDISDLYIDSSGNLWAAGSEKAGGNGPFRSIIYKIGIIRPDLESPFETIETEIPLWVMEGIKVESIGAPAEGIDESLLSFGTEDEIYGGIWRPLYPPVSY